MTESAPPLAVFAMGFATYRDSGLPDLPGVDAEIERLVRILTAFGGRDVAWPVPMDQRGADAIRDRLNEWTSTDTDRNTVLYWVGHGWSDTVSASLAHWSSPARVGVDGLQPPVLADKVAERQARSASWSMIVVEACHSARFIELVESELASMPHSPRRLLLVGVSGEGATDLGRFTDALSRSLENTFRVQREIELFSLGRELDRVLPGCHVVYRRIPATDVLIRDLPPIAAPPITVDIDDELKLLLADLTEDQRRHFLPKAQGAETGELPWYFEGRADEQRRVAAWLRASETGMLVVTGPPGSGKSALLGQVLTQSQPRLTAALERHRLAGRIPADQRPPADVFDAAILLTGLNVEQVVVRLADDLGLGAPPAGTDTLAGRIAWLMSALTATGPRTVLADALDEAQQPFEVTQALLAAARVPGVRLVVGTRRSTNEGPDLPRAPDENLLNALRAGGLSAVVVSVERDPAALGRYVTRRLSGLAGAAAPTADVERIASAVASRVPQFLFARLAVHEIAARPELLGAERAGELDGLINGDHRNLFATAVRRIGQRNRAYPALLRALAIGLGRGLPIRDGIWALVCTAIEAVNKVTDATVAGLLRDAAPYLMVDAEAEQSVYRLAHRTFQEHFQSETDFDHGAQRAHVLDALLRHADRQPDRLNPYVRLHLAQHAGVVGIEGLRRLAEYPHVVDRLDPVSLVIAAGAVPMENLPSPLAGIVVTRAQIIATPPAHRQATRQLAEARYFGRRSFTGEPVTPGSAWHLRWALLENHPVHAILRGHAAPIQALAVLSDATGGPLLASAGNDGAIRIWDVATGQPFGHPWTGHVGGVWALATSAEPGRGVRVYSAGDDCTIRIWDADTGTQICPPLTGHSGGILTLKTWRDRDRRVLLASAGYDKKILLWDVDSRRPIASCVGHTSAVRALTVFRGTDGQVRLASADRQGVILVWDGVTGDRVRNPWQAHDGPIQALATLHDADGRPQLASASYDGTVSVWDADSGNWLAGSVGHKGPVRALAVLAGASGELRLVSAGEDGGILIRRADDSWHNVRSWLVHTGPIRTLAGIVGPDGRAQLVSAGNDGIIRLWHIDATVPVDQPWHGATRPPLALAALPGPDRRVEVAFAGYKGRIQIIRADTGETVAAEWDGHGRDSSIHALTALPGSPGPTGLASVTNEGNVAIWRPDPAWRMYNSWHVGSGPCRAMAALVGPDGQTILAVADSAKIWVRVLDSARGAGKSLIGHQDLIRAIAVVRDRNGRATFASAGNDGTILLWNLETGRPAAPPLTGNRGSISALAALPRPGGGDRLASASDNGTVRVWDLDSGGVVSKFRTDRNLEISALAALPAPDGRTKLAIASHDQTIKIWDVDRDETTNLAVDTEVTTLTRAGDTLVAVGRSAFFAIRLGLSP
ncbi:AAA family ATPase [Micromonospora sp. DT227]|uniref:AAA family ATPase n=1 Tax=Micromonospora sp. DT227 TaxID=3393433 RepID=UPI003CEC5584